MKKKSKKPLRTHRHQAKAVLEVRKEVKREAKDNLQKRLRWASSDPG